MKRLLLGPRAVVEGLRADRIPMAIVYVQSGSDAGEVLALARQRHVPLESRSKSELDALARGERHQGVIAISGDYPYLDLDDLLRAGPPCPLYVALDQIQDPHNFGAIVRSAVAFGANGVITLKDRAAPVSAVVVRASAGATEAARIARVTNLSRALGELREHGVEAIGLDAEADFELDSLPFPPTGRALVVGSEGSGLRRLVREHCDHLARIPLWGPLASLNASVAAGIALHVSAQARARLTS